MTIPGQPQPGTPVSVHITVQVGDDTREFDAVAATDTNGFKVAEGLLTGLREEAKEWLWASQDRRR
ncbi:hypothetical protein GCM10010435_66020 [Winogradskya consettensis]|uniref:Uncharacterized protein n=1 Tax=Winogradskya consettensis TaxID=113560 RepID=A0A919W239_9ACTN|nr:hypothetical protein [Actinoplanes consettensis]GIM84769.1 hypothetical protein Aco04nite_93060 [Actinoplanes consettensis]